MSESPPGGLAYRLLNRVFDGIAVVTNALTTGLVDRIRTFIKGPGQGIGFVLVLVLTGVRIVVEDVLDGLDRVIEWIEKATMVVFLLAMTGFCFLEYMRREVPGFDFEVDGGANMAMVMMVWIGFLGASLATRRGQHLSVDASDRILTPGAAKIVKRFSALVAAGLCWILMKNSWLLTAEGLEFNDGLEGLNLWDGLVAPLNALIKLMPVEGEVRWLPLIACAVVAVAALRQLRIVESKVEDDEVPLPLLKSMRDPKAKPHLMRRMAVHGLEALAGVSGCMALIFVLPLIWHPTYEMGEAVEWHLLEQGDPFPTWLASIVLPLAFGLMALRFAVAGLLGRFSKQELTKEAPIAPKPKATSRTRADMIFSGWFPGLLVGVGATLWLGKPGLIILVCIVLVLVGAPLFVAIGVGALAAVTQLSDGVSGVAVATDMFEATKKQELLAIPFFVLAGNIMTQGSLADRLIGVARAFMGRMPGGLGLATIFACVIFAAISGSSPVTVIAIGGIMFPMLLKDRYPEGYSIGVLSSAGSLGIIIPPSIPMILYAVVTSSPQDPMNPGDLFLAGVLPGLLIAGVLAAYTLYKTRPTGEGRNIVLPKLDGGYWRNLGKALKRGVLALMLPVLILGGIYGLLGPIGIRFTVTEAAAVSVVYAIVIEMFVHRELSVRNLGKVLVESAVMMGSLFVIIVLAIALNKFLAFEKVPDQATEWLAARVDTKLQFLILVNIFLLLLGMFMEIISAILIVAPLLAPIAVGFGIDPVHFAIIFIVNLELGYLTPPMGINLFVASAVFKRSIVKVIRAALPFLLLMFLCLIAVAAFPKLSITLPCITNNTIEEGGVDWDGVKACMAPKEVTIAPAPEVEVEVPAIDLGSELDALDAPPAIDLGAELQALEAEDGAAPAIDLAAELKALEAEEAGGAAPAIDLEAELRALEAEEAAGSGTPPVIDLEAELRALEAEEAAEQGE
jgi:C4-dicarboxylate transporter DctM subunit